MSSKVVQIKLSPAEEHPFLQAAHVHIVKTCHPAYSCEINMQWKSNNSCNKSVSFWQIRPGSPRRIPLCCTRLPSPLPRIRSLTWGRFWPEDGTGKTGETSSKKFRNTRTMSRVNRGTESQTVIVLRASPPCCSLREWGGTAMVWRY